MSAATRKARVVALLRKVLADVDEGTRWVKTDAAGFELREVATWNAMLKLVDAGALVEFGVHQHSDLAAMMVTVEMLPRGVHIQIHLHGTPLADVLEAGARELEESDEITDVQTPRAKAARDRSDP